ncbi:MAG TPA: hypothetical protein VIG99_07800 [Myxococcaceae bacterium]
MPFEVTFFQLPCGARCARVRLRGIISEEDAVAHIERSERPGGDVYGLPILNDTREMESITPGARRLFAARSQADPWVAIVITNPVLRVGLNFLLRVRGASKKMRLFTAEPEALKWLDDRVREDLAAKPPP